MMRSILPTIALLGMVAPVVSHKNFVLISAPGSGKGTFSQYLVQEYGYVQVCPGDIFRSEIDAQTELGKKIQPIVEKGEYVDENIVCELIADHLSKITEQDKPFIIDGFPRSKISFQFLWKFLQDHNLVKNVCFLQLIANEDICINLIEGRLICANCCKVYNTSSAQPKKTNTCDDCCISLATRKADTRDIAKNRLDYFHANVEPLMDLAEELCTTTKIKADASLQELHTKYDALTRVNS
jgi:adenylate kinase